MNITETYNIHVYVSVLTQTMRFPYLLSFTFLLLFLFGACETPKGRMVSNIKTALKAKRYPEALKLVQEARKDSLLNNHAKFYHLGLESSKRIYGKENEKHYLKRNADTIALFRSLYNIYEYALLIDSIEQGKNLSTVAETMKALLPNLNAATLFFLHKQQWKEVLRYTNVGFEVRRSSAFRQAAIELPDSLYTQWAWRNLFAAYQQKDYRQVLEHAKEALNNRLHRAITLEMLANAYATLGNKSQQMNYLKQGVEEFPEQEFFVSTLSEEYLQAQQPDSVLAFTSPFLKSEQQLALVLKERARAYLAKEDYDNCIKTAQAMLSFDDKSPFAHYYKGYSALQKAKFVEMPLSISSANYRSAYQQQRDYYQQAKKSLETYRQLAPQQSNIWAPLLYEVYLKLNLGAEFEEISRHLPL